MVAPKNRSGSRKRISRRTPGGRTVLHYKKKKSGRALCGRCGKPLQGTPKSNYADIRKMSRSERAPTRAYAGVLCSDCTEGLQRYVTRFEVKFGYPEYADMEVSRDLTIEKFLPKGWFSEISRGSAGKKAKNAAKGN